ncbi:MAG: alpha/beta hydrolase, partial [Pseudomonadota bacterium]|nr:alpha/beta hydrolase [Pseudomonadota bacterium]
LWRTLSDAQRREIMTAGRVSVASQYGGAYLITRQLIEDGRRHLILGEGVHSHCPVRILVGEEDADVPWRHVLAVYQATSGDDVTLTLVKGGDHRLSTPGALETILDTVRALAGRADSPHS